MQKKKYKKRNRKGTERAKFGMLLMNKHWLCLTLNERRSFSRKPNVKNYAKRAKKIKEFLKKKPTEWRLYANTMYAMENGIPKKYWKLVKNLFPKQKS